MTQLHSLANLHWAILLGLSVTLLFWRLGRGPFLGRWVAARFPIALAAADLVLFPLLVLGS